MDTMDIGDPVFREAVAAIDAGDVQTLERILAEHPRLLSERLEGGEGYFKDPYLIWFVAENPVRNDTLPANIAEVTRVLIDAARRSGVGSLQLQLDYALGLVSSGRVGRERGAQLALIDTFCDAGADPNGALVSALAHREVDAADRLLARGADTTLFAAACLKRHDVLDTLLDASTAESRQGALTGAALFGNDRALRKLIGRGVDIGAFSPSWCHPHATPLHHAVDSGRLEAVRVLVEAGAPLDVPDRVYGGRPVGWAEHLGRREIEFYLRAVEQDARTTREPAETPGALHLRNLVTMLSVADLTASIAFYEKLGFEVRNTFEPSDGSGASWASLVAGVVELMLSREALRAQRHGDAEARSTETAEASGRRVLFYAYFDDVVAARNVLEASGVEVGTMTFPFYAPRGEFQVTDPDGFVVMVTHT